jgi:tetratricopeptide (TPR) repeat protein
MNIRLLAPAVLLLAAPAFAQKAKSNDEVIAIQKVQQATTPAAQLAAIDYVLATFADTQYKATLLTMATDTANRSHDYEKTVIYGERALEADPKSIDVRMILAGAIVQRTRVNDLDKDAKLKQVDTYANDGLALLKTAPNPRPDFTAEQWAEAKKDLTATFYDILGMSADLKKDYPAAITDFKTSIASASRPQALTLARLAKAYNENKQYDDAIATANQILSMADAQPIAKTAAQQEKDKANKMKAAPAN